MVHAFDILWKKYFQDVVPLDVKQICEVTLWAKKES